MRLPNWLRSLLTRLGILYQPLAAQLEVDDIIADLEAAAGLAEPVVKVEVRSVPATPPHVLADVSEYIAGVLERGRKNKPRRPLTRGPNPTPPDLCVPEEELVRGVDFGIYEVRKPKVFDIAPLTYQLNSEESFS